MKYNDKWAFAVEAYEGSGGFDTKVYIDKHARESDTKYEERQKIAYYSNIFVQKVGRYIGYLYKTSPIRVSKDKMIQLIFNDANNAGDNMDVFMSGLSKLAKVRGTAVVLIDMPKVMPKTKGQQIEQRAVPYFVNIIPENIVAYKMDKFGKFEYVAYSDVIDNSTYDKEDKTEVIRYYDKKDWKVITKNGKAVDNGSHNLGICPIIHMGENGVFPDIGEFTQVSKIAKRHFNLESEMDDIMRGQTFSILTLQADNPSDVAITLSTDNAIKYGKGMNAPSFIAPDVSPAETYEKKIKALEVRIDDITYDISTGLSAESGVALDIKFQGLNGSLSNFAMRMEDFEIRLFDVANRYLKSKAVVQIMYPKTFDITDLEKEIATLDKIKSLGYTIKTYESVKLKQIVDNDLNNLSPEQQAVINAEIDDMFKEEK